MEDKGTGKSILIENVAGDFHPNHSIIRFDAQEHWFENVIAPVHVFPGRELLRKVVPFSF